MLALRLALGNAQIAHMSISHLKKGARHYIMLKGSMQQEDLTILNIYAPNTGAPRYIKQVINNLQRDLDSHTIIVGDFNTPLSILDQQDRTLKRTSRT